MPRVRKPRAPRARKVPRRAPRRRLQPLAKGAFVYWMGKKIYEYNKAYKTTVAKINARRQQQNMKVSANIVKYPAGLTIGRYVKPTLQQKIKDTIEEPVMFRQTHAYKINADSGRMNWFHTQSLNGSTLLQYLNKMRDSVSDGTVVNPNIDEPASSVGTGNTPQQFYKHLISYNSVQYQLVNSSTNTIKAVVMWIKPKRELPLYINAGGSMTTTFCKPTNMFAVALNALKPPVDVYNGSNFTQDSATAGFSGLSTTTDYNRGGNSGTNNNSNDNVLETDLNVKPSSSVCKDVFGYYFDIVKSTDIDLAPGQQTEFWLKQHERRTTLYQATSYDSIPDVTMYCMIGIQGQIVGTNATTGDVNVVSTGSGQLSVIETQKTIIKPVTNRAPKIWNYTNDLADNGVLVQLADASQEIINDETDGVDNTYNEVN